MAITTTYNINIAYKELWANQEREYFLLVEQMKVHCIKFLRDARGQPQGHPKYYNDRTTMLRNSIAAYILRDSKIIWSDENGNVNENRRLIREVPIVRKGFTAIVIAGKDYASKVEQYGYNVISEQGRDVVGELEITFIKMKNTIKI